MEGKPIYRIYALILQIEFEFEVPRALAYTHLLWKVNVDFVP